MRVQRQVTLLFFFSAEKREREREEIFCPFLYSRGRSQQQRFYRLNHYLDLSTQALQKSPHKVTFINKFALFAILLCIFAFLFYFYSLCVDPFLSASHTDSHWGAAGHGLGRHQSGNNNTVFILITHTHGPKGEKKT